jgi:hypothetical protein
VCEREREREREMYCAEGGGAEERGEWLRMRNALCVHALYVRVGARAHTHTHTWIFLRYC